MPHKKYNRISTLVLTVGLMVLAMPVATPAYAGFEWKPSDGTQPPMDQAPISGTYLPSPAPTANTAPEIISPVIITGDAASAPTSTQVLTPSGKTNLATATISISHNAPVDKVKGFGSAIPLTLALHQIVPADYSTSIDPDVDMNTLVSYKGGQPWRDTLHDALTSVGLMAREEGTMVTVRHMATASETPAPVLMPIEATRTISQSPFAPVPSPAVAMPMAESWNAERGSTLHKVLTDWCRHAGVELQWQAEYDYPVEASAHFGNGFEGAVRGLLAGFDGARPQPIGELHTNSNAGQMVLVVQARGNNYSN